MAASNALVKAAPLVRMVLIAEGAVTLRTRSLAARLPRFSGSSRQELIAARQRLCCAMAVAIGFARNNKAAYPRGERGTNQKKAG